MDFIWWDFDLPVLNILLLVRLNRVLAQICLQKKQKGVWKKQAWKNLDVEELDMEKDDVEEVGVEGVCAWEKWTWKK